MPWYFSRVIVNLRDYNLIHLDYYANAYADNANEYNLVSNNNNWEYVNYQNWLTTENIIRIDHMQNNL